MTLQISTGVPFPREAQLQNGRVQWGSSHFEHENMWMKHGWLENPPKTELLVDRL
jgi:hypothetical protein